eukprot:gene36128-44557_t
MGKIDECEPGKEETYPSKTHWYNNMFPLKWFKDALFYTMTDTRSQQQYTHVSNADYVRDGTEAENNRQTWIESYEGSYFLEFFKGTRGISDKVRKLTEADIIKADSLVNAFLIPSGFSGVYNMKFPLRRTGHLRAKEHSIFLASVNIVIEVELNDPVLEKSKFYRVRKVYFANRKVNPYMRAGLDFVSWVRLLHQRRTSEMDGVSRGESACPPLDRPQ